MGFSTHSEYRAASASEKVGLVTIDGARRLVSWSLYSGSVYYIVITEQVIIGLTQSGTALTSAASVSAISAGKYYYDRHAGRLYLQCTDSSAPDSKFIAMTFRNFFSNVPLAAPWDLGTGFDVEWLPLLRDNSEFVVAIENTQNLLGLTVSSSSSLKLVNDRTVWDLVFDNVSFESQPVAVYSWTRQLPITEAQLLYKGYVDSRQYASDSIRFVVKDFLDEMRSPVTLPLMSAYVGASIPDALKAAFQRTLYGYVRGHVPTPIDQVLPTTGYPITGTLSVTSGSTAVVGSGTSFLSQLTPGDDLFVGVAIGRVRVDAITDDTHLTLAEAYGEANQTAVSARVIPSHAKRYANRTFVVAGHALARPAMTVLSYVDNATIFVDSTASVQEGDPVEFGGTQTTIRQLGTGFLKLTNSLPAGLTIGSIIYRSSVSNVYLDGYLLQLTRDYTYDAATAKITLDPLAEFNVAPSRTLAGTTTFTNASRNVTGTGTAFRTQLPPGSFIKHPSTGVWYEVLVVTDDTNLILRGNSSGAGTGTTLYRSPRVYDNNSSKLTCDALGKASGGTFLRGGGAIAKDILTTAGFGANLDTATFDTVDELAPHQIGFALPTKYSDKTAPRLRDVLNGICRSLFASITLENSFLLRMVVLEPSYSGTPTTLSEPDVIDLKVNSDSTQLAAQAQVSYDIREYDPASATALTRVSIVTNNQYLFSTDKTFTLDTYLTQAEDATIVASRWAFILSRPNSDVTLSTKLQAALLQTFDTLKLNHEKLYQRFGSTARMRIGAITSLTKTIGDVQVIINDLGGAFARCARIAPAAAPDYGSCTDDQKLLYGFMTDGNGLTSGSSGINLFW